MTDPSQVKRPTEPPQVRAPTDPSQVTALTDLSQVTRPAEPSQVERPAEPSQFTRPAEPSQVERPAEPSQVTRPAEPSQVERPAEPSQVTALTEPSQVTASTGSSQVTRLTLGQQIRDLLVVDIVSGAIPPGERLVETRLAARFGTSQAPVREALRELEAMRMVETRPRRGTFVRHFVQQTLRESYVVRAALEETATRLAMLAGTMPVAALREAVKAMRAAARARDDEAAAKASVTFHRKIIEAAHNELLRLSWEALQIEARTAVTMVAAEVKLTDMVRDHASLLSAIESGDLETACRHARDHQWHYADLPHDAHGRLRPQAS